MRVLIATMMALTAGLALPSAAAADHGRTSARIHLRFGPSLDYRSIVVIPRGRRLYVRRCLPGLRWCEVQYGRYVGWCRADYLYHEHYRRPFSRVGVEVHVPLFEFFAHISDFDRDRHRRYRRHRHSDDYYHRLKRHHRRHDRGRRHHRRGHRKHRDRRHRRKNDGHHG